MNYLVFPLASLLLAAGPVAAQSSGAALDSPAAYRRQELRGPEHARLVNDLLRYELRNIRRLVTDEVLLRPDGYSYRITNRATLAEITSGSYTITYYDAQDKILTTTTGTFGGMAPAASRNGSASFPRPPDTARAELKVTAIEAE